MGLEASAIMAISAISGTAISGVSAVQQYGARKDATAASKRAENLREEQMNLDRMRKQRASIRSAQNARALYLVSDQISKQNALVFVEVIVI